MNPPKSPFRVRIGVTGHRVINNPESIARKVKEILRSKIYKLLANEISQEKPIPALTFTIVTPLAEGADRLVAKEVLKLPESDIEVVLPFAKEEYLNDFETEESRQEFEELYRKSQKTIVQNNLSEGMLSTIERTEVRNKAYEDVGRYVVTHCDVLIALWDGRPSRGRGATAEIVGYAREKKHPLIIIFTENS